MVVHKIKKPKQLSGIHILNLFGSPNSSNYKFILTQSYIGGGRFSIQSYGKNISQVICILGDKHLF